MRFGAAGLESDRMRDHIADMARRLQQAQKLMSPQLDPGLEERRLKVWSRGLPRLQSGCHLAARRRYA